MSASGILALLVALVPLTIATFVLGDWIAAMLGYGSGLFVGMVAVSSWGRRSMDGNHP